jgi:Uma2 family endonuclease
MDSARASTPKLTYDDFLLFPDDGQRHELIDGEHYVTPSPSTRHQRLSMRLTGALLDCLKVNPVGELFAAPYDVVFGRFDIVEPDLLLVTGDQVDVLTDVHARGAPSLVVEILSKGTRRVDLQTKRDLYERAGVREYWVIDGEMNRIAIHRRASDGRMPQVADLSESDTLTTPLLPGFSLPLQEYFRR